jgi:CMP-N-acetylneuraminic acid synthetase
MKIIIPAREGSKGLPGKNRVLFKHTADIIPKNLYNDVIVTSDDPEILSQAKDYGFNINNRPYYLATDDANIRDVLYHTLKEYKIHESEEIIMLYLTYPERTWDDVIQARRFFLTHLANGITKSMLCKKEVETSPYLMMHEVGVDGLFGSQLVKHDLYRRQDYPICFEISHYIVIFIANGIYNLNRNLYNDSTIFWPIQNVIDVDLKKDLIKFNGK